VKPLDKYIKEYKEIQDSSNKLKEVKAKQQKIIEVLTPAIPIKIEGCDYFKVNTLKALHLIKNKLPEEYNAVLNYINKIKQGNNSQWFENNLINKIFSFGELTYSSLIECYASSIVHDSYHSKLYHDYCKTYGTTNVPYNVYGGENGEYACLEYQISFLEKINAEKSLIDQAKSSRMTHWWETDINW